MKIGVYGGTFDPIHHAHLILAREAAEDFGLEKVIFVPAATSPYKAAPIAAAKLRLQMLQAAIADEALFEINECELHRPPPSYTIETIELLGKEYRHSELFLLIGDDNLAGLPGWKRFTDLRKMVTIIVLPRLRTEVRHEYLSVNRRVDISATEIRDRVAKRKPINYLVPPAVEQIIRTQKLYQEAIPSTPIL
jgi:nicotinate-nucleotide adenylyltransferase